MSVIGESRGISEKLRGFFENIFCVLYVLCTLYILVFYTSTISTYLRKKQKTKLIVLTITFDVKQLKTINPAEGVENVINLFFFILQITFNLSFKSFNCFNCFLDSTAKHCFFQTFFFSCL